MFLNCKNGQIVSYTHLLYTLYLYFVGNFPLVADMFLAINFFGSMINNLCATFNKQNDTKEFNFLIFVSKYHR